jgi:hypothetical protein
MKDKLPGKTAPTEEISANNESTVPVSNQPTYPEKILELVRREAMAMITEGVTEKSVQFGWEREGGSFWLSTRPEQLVDPQAVEVDGSSVYFSIFHKEQQK